MHPCEQIPQALTTKPNWVVWGVPGEPMKAPFQPGPLLRLNAVAAKSGVPATWGSYEAAKQCVDRGLARGIGYEFDGSGIYGVDLDHVVEDGVVTPEAMEIVRALGSYTESSPSGGGLHIFVAAEDVSITRHRRQGGFVEIYSTARYFTVTGNVFGGYDAIASRPAELQQIHDHYLLLERWAALRQRERVRPSPDEQAGLLVQRQRFRHAGSLCAKPLLRAERRST